MHIVTYLRDRLAEPGTLRSCAVLLWGVSTATNSADVWEAGIGVALALLGGVSALKPETK